MFLVMHARVAQRVRELPCILHIQVDCAEMAEPIEMLFGGGGQTHVCPLSQ